MTSYPALATALALSAVLASPGHAGVVGEPEIAPAIESAPVVDACGAALDTASASTTLEKADANALHAAIGAAIRKDASCAPRVKSWLLVHACTQAHGVVSSAAFGTNEWPAAWSAEIVDRALTDGGSCIEATLPSVEQSANVDQALVGSVARATKHRDADTRDAGWLLLGTLERRARATGVAGIASELDGRIATELRARMKQGDADVLLEAAGNGGCTACVKDVELALAAKDPTTRRVAAGALRFVVEPGTTERACKVLRSDENANVRAHTAWSLGWSRHDLGTRADCLRDAALNDPSEAVRTDAARAIEQLVNESSSSNPEDQGA
jgi:hypothetical protein